MMKQTSKWYATALVILSLSLIPVNARDSGLSYNGDSPVPYATSAEKNSSNLIPSPLVKLSGDTESYVLIVDKSQQKLMLYQYSGSLRCLKIFNCTTGLKSGNKQTNGDMKTPEGIYFFTNVWERMDLIKTYGRKEASQFGIRAFNLDYPNEADRIKRRNGFGIWLHGTDNEDRLKPENSRGCIVVSDADLAELTQYISLNKTPVIIVNEISYSPTAILEDQYMAVADFIEKWRKSWENRDYEAYEAAYSSSFKSGKMPFNRWITGKKQTLQKYNSISITFSNIKILKSAEYYVVEFFQEFRADTYRDTGIKRLYISNNGKKLEIINEIWEVLTTNNTSL